MSFNVCVDRVNAMWSDLRVSLTQTKVGAINTPDFDYTNVGYLFPQNNAAEIVYIIVQMPHDYKLGTNIKPHVHWQQSAATAVTWKMDYKWFKNGAAVPASFTTLTTNTGVFTYTSGNLLQVSSFGEIDGSAMDAISSMLLIKLYRDDNVTTGDVLAFEFDIHYQRDSLGSRFEFVK